jgi:uncharacterized membrane protein YdbT with pleckstrin-like domain
MFHRIAVAVGAMCEHHALPNAGRPMASYVETILGPGEQVTHVGRVSLLSILPSLVVGVILVIVALGMLVGSSTRPDFMVPAAGVVALAGVLVFIVAIIRRNSTELAVTNRRVIAKFGFIGRRTIEMNLAKIESVRVEQSVMGRLFDFGSVVVVGTGSSLDPIPFIAHPIAFRQAIQAATDALPRA